MEQRFSPLPLHEEMLSQGPKNLVENADMGPENRELWKEWMAAQQLQAAEQLMQLIG